VKTTAIEPAVTPLSVHLIGVRPLSLLLGQGSNEFAAEVGDVGDHAAPDRVGSGQETQECVSDGHLGGSRKTSHFPAGVLAGVARDTREGESIRAAPYSRTPPIKV
jgi:hypothetical protein